jgi:hypothetical protein
VPEAVEEVLVAGRVDAVVVRSLRVAMGKA